MTSPSPPSPQRPTRADLLPLPEKDFSEIAAFIAVQSGKTRESVEDHLRWFLLENPARQPQDPLGFGLRSSDQLVGCILCSPQNFCIENKEILFIGSSSFYVDESHRGHGGRIFLQYSRLGNQHPLFGTSANAEAAALWKASGANPIPNSDRELFGILHWPPVVEEFVHRRYPNPILEGLARTPLSNLAGLSRPLKIDFEDVQSGSLQPLTSAEQVMDLPIHGPSARLTALRDLPYIRWRYFSGRDQTVAAFAFRNRQRNQEILVTVNRRTRGHRGQINTLNLLDVYPEVPAQEWLQIVATLTARYRNVVDAVVLRNLSPEPRKMFCDRAFQPRVFDAPTGWFLDKRKSLPTHDWYIVPADGDGLI
jgi:hypothetical protein